MAGCKDALHLHIFTLVTDTSVAKDRIHEGIIRLLNVGGPLRTMWGLVSLQEGECLGL